MIVELMPLRNFAALCFFAVLFLPQRAQRALRNNAKITAANITQIVEFSFNCEKFRTKLLLNCILQHK